MKKNIFSIFILSFLFLLSTIFPAQAENTVPLLEKGNSIIPSLAKAGDGGFELEIKDNLINLQAEQASFKEILKDLEKKTRIELNIFNGVEDKKVSLNISSLPVYAIHALLEKMALENFVVVYDKELASKVIYVLPKDKDIASVIKGKTIIKPARFADGKNINQIKRHEITTITRGKNNISIRYVKDELLLKFHLGVTKEEVEEILKRHNLVLIDDKSLSKIVYVKVSIPDGREVIEVIKEVRNEYKVKIPEPNYIAGILAVSDPLYDNQWYVPDTKFDKAWDVTKSKNQVKVAVIDTGVKAEHPDLEGRILKGYDFVDNDSDASDDHGHGTFVAGIISATANDIGIKGLYDYAEIIPIKVIDVTGIGTYEDTAKGIIYAADNGAKVINLSIGGYGYSFMLQDAVDYALEKGCIVVAAGGNDGIEQEIYPAGYPDVIGVSAIANNGQIWSDSNSGRHIDVSAPGVNILSTGLNNDYVYATGTSASAPMVSALAGMLAIEKSDLSSSVIERLIMQTAKDLGEKGRDKIYGSGEIDALAALEQEIEPFHDVTVRSVNIEPMIFEKGKPTFIVANIENAGTYESENFDVVLYEIVGEEKKEIGKKESIIVIDKIKVIFEWKPEGIKENIKFEVVVFSENDTNTSNNSKTTQSFLLEETDNFYVLHSVDPPTHQWIAYQAFKILENEDPVSPLVTEIADYFPSAWSNDYRILNNTLILNGVWTEDEEVDLLQFFECWLSHPYCNHFWDPDGGPDAGLDGWYPLYRKWDSAYRRAQQLWDTYVIPNYPDQIGTAYYWLGRVAHILTDMSVPAHTHLDAHPVANSYESYMGEFDDDKAGDYNYKQWEWEASGSPTSSPSKSCDSFLASPSKLCDLFLNMAEISDEFDSNDASGEDPSHYKGHNGAFEIQNDILPAWYDVSYAESKIHGESLMPEAMRHVAGLYQLFWERTNSPIVNAFYVTPGSIALGNTLMISYSVSDQGDSQLKQVELWRANIDGTPSDLSWTQIGQPKQISGNGPITGSFSDTPPSAGNYWYGIHVVDNQDNWNDERNSHTNGVPGVYGPDKVTVTVATDTTPPTVSITYPANNATVSGTITVTVSTSDNIGITKVNYYLDNSSTVEYTANSAPFSWAWNTTALSNGSHSIKAIAYDAANNSSSPSIITVTVNNPTGNNAPNIPSQLYQYKSDGITALPVGATTNESTVVMKGNVTDPDNDPVLLEVEVRPVGTSFTYTPSPNCTSTSGTVASGGTAVATCSGLADGQYHWQARAKDSYGAASNWQSAGRNSESAADFIVSATTGINYPPSVTLISPNGGETLIAGSSYTIKWIATDDQLIQSIGLLYSTDSGANWTSIVPVISNTGSYQWTVPNVTTSTAKIAVLAYDGQLTGIGYSSGNFSIVSSCASPSISTLQSITPSGNSYTVNWTVSSGVINYNLQEDTSSSFTNPTVVYISNGLSWYSGDKLPGTYYYRVKAVNNCGVSGWSDTQSVTIQVNQGPGAITALNPADGATNQPLSVSLSWSASHLGGETLRYNVYVCQGDTTIFYPNCIKSYGQTATTYNLSNLPYNTIISWGIEAIDDTGDTRFSSMFHFTTIADTSAPTGSILINNGAASTTSYSVTLNLSASDSGSGIRWMRFSNDGTYWTNWELYSTEYPWNLADWNYGGQYGLTTYTVYAQFRDYEGNESTIYSDSITKTAGTPGQIILNGKIYQTIQDAIDAASPGDTVYLTEGTYAFSATVFATNHPNSTGIQMKPSVTLMGAGAEKTVIDVRGSAFAAIVDADNSVIEGVTIINSGSLNWRYVVLLESDSSVIKNCVIRGGVTGVFMGYDAPYSATNSVISNNVIIDNTDKGIWLKTGSNISIYNNTIVDNNSYGFFGWLGSAKMINNVVYNNIVGVWSYNNPSLYQNNDVFGNSSANYVNIPDQTGSNGNISVNPSFVNSSGGDYHLNAGSPCINTGTNVGIPYSDSVPDMGAFEYNGTGTIQVTSNRSDASFTIKGPLNTYTGNGTSWSMSNLPIGIYTITFAPITNLYSPSYQAKVLFSGQTIIFDGTYQNDAVGPTGNITINFSEYATADSLINISFDITDEVAGIGTGSQMMFSNDGVTWSPAESYSSIKKDWDLILYGGDIASGVKTVYAKVSDLLGNWTTFTDTILFVPNRQVLEYPTQYSTIQTAIDVAQDGDIVYVLPGNYNMQETITLKQGVRLQGAGATQTVFTDLVTINGATNSMIDGFGGYLKINYSLSGQFIILNNIVTRGISIGWSNNQINSIIRNNIIGDNYSGVIVSGSANVSIENNTFINNSNYAIWIDQATPDTKVYLVNNVIANNNIGIVDTNTSDIVHQHIFPSFNTYWNNTSNFSGYFNKMGPGDINSDPMFVNTSNDDYHLQNSSVSINSGNPETRYNDPDGTRNDRGAYGGPSLNTPPNADFSISPSTGSTNSNFTYDASLSHDGETKDERLKVRWDINGDGTYDTSFSTNKVFVHQYNSPGTYNATLQVKDDGGYISTISKSIIVINQYPYVPGNPYPADSLTSQDINVILIWTGGDPDLNDALTYDIYLGTTANPPLISSDQIDTFYNPGTLSPNTTYYWKVVSKDNHGASSISPLWYFVTGAYDSDGDGYSSNVDCNDSNPNINPGASDVNCDGIDNNCNGQNDDGYVPTPTICGIGACASTGQNICQNGQIINTCTPGQPTGNDDTCNGIDENCSGIADDGYVPTNTTCGQGVCVATGQNICVNGTVQDNCIPGQPTGTDTNCNGIDENCSGTADEGYLPTNTNCGMGICASIGQLSCQNGAIIDTCIPGQPQTEGPSGSATCSDALDNDCDGLTDADDTDCGGGSGGTINLPKTGQTTCYDSLGNMVACLGTGQDGEIQAGVSWPDPRFSSGTGTEAECITDNLTGLMWPKNGDLGGAMTWNNAVDYANNFNLCGYSDWRLSNVNELESLINADVSNTATWLNTQGFSNVRAGYYWSSTTYANDMSSAWVVGMLDEYVTYYNKSNYYYYVLPVRSGPLGGSFGYSEIWKTGQTVSYRPGDDGDLEIGAAWPNPKFTVNGDCVTDNLTGLMWSRNANLAGYMNWNAALNYANNLTLCGYSDWRLPNRKELRSLIDYSRYSSALPAWYPFTNVQSYKYWSSTTSASYYADYAWLVDMWDGGSSPSDKVNSYYVWPVRGGQVGTAYYCDDDSDGYIDSSIDGTCAGSGCVPSGCQTAAGDDCDDADASIYLGAPELCDNKDNNCNGQIDEGLLSTYYQDSDSDGYGNPNITIQACTQPSGYVSNNTDCNDSDLSINPAATEVCDGIDNDCDGQIDEGNVCGAPDLLVSTWTAPANACAGATISIKDTTKNQGTGTAGASQSCFYFSTNTTLDTGDTPLGCRAVPSLNPAAISTGTTSVTLPNVTIGKYYLIAMADDGKVVPETNETNNKKSKAIYIGPDLIVSALTAPTSAIRGTTISIGDTTKNKGCGTAGASTTKFYLSTNTKLEIGTDTPLGSRAVPTLGTSASNKGTTSVVIPAGIPTGKYYIIANSDDAKVVVEGNETNNKKTKAITINP